MTTEDDKTTTFNSQDYYKNIQGTATLKQTIIFSFTPNIWLIQCQVHNILFTLYNRTIADKHHFCQQIILLHTSTWTHAQVRQSQCALQYPPTMENVPTHHIIGITIHSIRYILAAFYHQIPVYLCMYCISHTWCNPLALLSECFRVFVTYKHITINTTGRNTSVKSTPSKQHVCSLTTLSDGSDWLKELWSEDARICLHAKCSTLLE